MSEDHGSTGPGLPQHGPIFFINFRGVKVRLTPSDSGTSTPKTWRETGDIANHQLMRLVVGVFRFLAEIPYGFLRLWWGLTGTPGAAVTRPRGSHANTNQAEHRRRRPSNLTPPHPENTPAKKLTQPPDKTLPPGPKTPS